MTASHPYVNLRRINIGRRRSVRTISAGWIRSRPRDSRSIRRPRSSRPGAALPSTSRGTYAVAATTSCRPRSLIRSSRCEPGTGSPPVRPTTICSVPATETSTRPAAPPVGRARVWAFRADQPRVEKAGWDVRRPLSAERRARGIRQRGGTGVRSAPSPECRPTGLRGGGCLRLHPRSDEAWVDRRDEAVFPLAPGVSAVSSTATSMRSATSASRKRRTTCAPRSRRSAGKPADQDPC